MKKFQLAMLAFVMTAFLAVTATAEPIGRPDYKTLLKSTDAFTFVMDISGSMMQISSERGKTQFNQPKIVMAKQVVAAINDRMPTLDYMASLYTVSGVTNPVKAGAWNRAAYGKAVSAIPATLAVWGRLTNLGADFAAIQSGLKGASVFVTDGVSNIGPDAIAAFSRAQKASGAKFAIISLADTAEGKATIKKMAAAAGNALVVNAADLMYDPVAVDAFVKAMFYKEVTPAINKVVFFDTGKYDLKPEAIAILDDCIVTILNAPRGVRTVEVEGWADSRGGFGPSNDKLSENRARAVVEYFKSKGVPAEKIYMQGNNVSYQFNNATAAGRQDNRRTNIIIN